MFDTFKLQETGYNRVNSYLTMLASRMVFHDAYISVLNVRDSVVGRVVGVGAGAVAGGLVGAAISLVIPGGIFIFGALVIAGALVGGIAGGIVGGAVDDASTDRRREEEYIDAAGAFFRSHGALDVKFINDEGAIIPPFETGFNAVLLRTSNCILIAIRGTQMEGFDLITKSDMLSVNTEIEMVQSSFIDGDDSAIHKGLNFVLETYVDEIVSIINEFNNDSGVALPVILAGHSLGGATASVLALGIGAKLDVIMVYSHAGYMPGNKEFGQKFSGLNHNRTVYGWDYVPLFPKNIIDFMPVTKEWIDENLDLWGSYTHVEGNVAWINHNDNSVGMADENRLEEISRGRPHPDINHHRTERYLSALFNDLSSQDQAAYLLTIPL